MAGASTPALTVAVSEAGALLYRAVVRALPAAELVHALAAELQQAWTIWAE